MNKKNKFLAGILILLPVIVIIVVKLVNIFNSANVKFYYPDQKYDILKVEKRNFTYNEDRNYFEEKLVEEYFLGPLDYNLAFPIDHDNFVKEIIRVKNRGNMVIIINFHTGFSAYALAHYENVEWLIKGMIRTLRENTRITKIYFLENSRKMRLQIGDWQLFYPIKIKIK